jgi:hypothetical protein
MFEIHDEVRCMTRDRVVPAGIAVGTGYSPSLEWMVLVDVPDHPNNYPRIIVPELLCRAIDVIEQVETAVKEKMRK